MRIFVAGAGGAVGSALLPHLIGHGHTVVGMTQSSRNAQFVRSTGAEHIVADALDKNAVLQAVQIARPDAIIEQLTSIPRKLNPRRFDQEFAATNRLRTTGTDNLVAAAQALGVRKFVAQSFAPLPYARSGGPVKTEEDRLDTNPPKGFRSTLDAIRHLEERVTKTTGIDGIALRYGYFYGPVASVGGVGAMIDDVRHRRLPIVGNGAGVWSFVHIDDVATATLAAVERGTPGVYNIVDDEPTPASVWLPALAEMVGAKPPMHIPTWLARLVVGDVGVVMMTEARGASNAKAKQQLGWKPMWSTWRDGFRHEFVSGSQGRATGRRSA